MFGGALSSKAGSRGSKSTTLQGEHTGLSLAVAKREQVVVAVLKVRAVC